MRYVISEGVANCRHIPMEYSLVLSCASYQNAIYSELNHGWNWNEDLTTIGSSKAICVPTRLHSHVLSCIS